MVPVHQKTIILMGAVALSSCYLFWKRPHDVPGKCVQCKQASSLRCPKHSLLGRPRTNVCWRQLQTQQAAHVSNSRSTTCQKSATKSSKFQRKQSTKYKLRSRLQLRRCALWQMSLTPPWHCTGRVPSGISFVHSTVLMHCAAGTKHA